MLGYIKDRFAFNTCNRQTNNVTAYLQVYLM